MTTEEMIEVLRASSEGKDIERLAHTRSKLWGPHPKEEHLNFRGYIYRIVKQPESIKVDIWEHRGNGLIISVTSHQNIPSSPRDGWKLLKIVTIEVRR